MAGSVTLWLGQLKEGDRAALRELWERYFTQMVSLARQKLRTAPRQASDEEDVAVSAFDSLWQGVQQGRFPRLEDRDDLWQVLMLITARKAINQRKHETRQKRGGGKVWHASGLTEETEGAWFASLISQEPDPTLVAEMVEARESLLMRLQDDELRRVATWKLEGYSNAEIAKKLSCVERTVERRLRIIRQTWQQLQDESES